jgi:glyoxylase-like metal-dependent hydrolase (beta-lactamase superfamily II)
MGAFTEIAADVYVLRHPVLDVNATLILGGEVALVVDTLSTAEQATHLLGHVRGVTSMPLVIVNTHHHYDPCFGNATLADASPGTTIWAQQSAAAALRDRGDQLRRAAEQELIDNDPEFAAAVAAVQLRAPDRTVVEESIMDLGGRSVDLRHFGRGHTDGDLVVTIPDVGVLLTGDLIEEGAPPSFVDAYPVEWPETLAALLHAVAPPEGPATVATVLPGHGAPVDLAYVHRQHDELTTLAWLIREGHYDGVEVDHVVAKAPFGPEAARTAIIRGYAELDGRI